MERTELVNKTELGGVLARSPESETVEAPKDKGPRQACPRLGERMGLRTRRRVGSWRARGKRSLDGFLLSTEKVVPHPEMLLGLPSWDFYQVQNADPWWAQKIRPWPGGAGHFLPTVLSGDRPAGPRPGPPRRVFRRSSLRL